MDFDWRSQERRSGHLQEVRTKVEPGIGHDDVHVDVFDQVHYSPNKAVRISMFFLDLNFFIHPDGNGKPDWIY